MKRFFTLFLTLLLLLPTAIFPAWAEEEDPLTLQIRALLDPLEKQESAPSPPNRIYLGYRLSNGVISAYYREVGYCASVDGSGNTDYSILTYEDYGRVYTLEFQNNTLSITAQGDYSKESLPAAWDDGQHQFSYTAADAKSHSLFCSHCNTALPVGEHLYDSENDRVCNLCSHDRGESLTGTLANGLRYSITNGEAGIVGYSANDTIVMIPDTIEGYPVTFIGERAFYDCRRIVAIQFPKNVKTIGAYAFCHCTGLASLTLPEGLKTIGDYAFCYCTNLTTLTLPQGLTAIGNSAFSDCSSLSQLTLSQGLVTIGPYAFYDCLKLSSVTLPQGLQEIGKGAFFHCKSLTDIILPEGLTSLGDDSFFYCLSLQSLSIPQSLTAIGTAAFLSCDALTRVSYQGTPQQWSAIAVGNSNESLKKATVTFPSASPLAPSTAKPSPSTDSDLSNLQYKIENQGVTITKYLGSATRVSLPDTIEGYPVTAIGNYAFYNQRQLQSIRLPQGLKTIGNSAFNYCTALLGISLPEGLLSVGNHAFCYCLSLKSVSLPQSLQTLGTSAFSDCALLSSVALPQGLTHISEKAFFDCPSLSSVPLPDGLISIGEKAFFNCSSLTELQLPESLTTVEKDAFFNCKFLTKVQLPQSLASVEDGGFFSCPGLETVHYPGTRLQWEAVSVGPNNEDLLEAILFLSEGGSSPDLPPASSAPSSPEDDAPASSSPSQSTAKEKDEDEDEDEENFSDRDSANLILIVSIFVAICIILGTICGILLVLRNKKQNP